MTSNALTNLTIRLKDIDQLLNAHTAITKFKKAEQAAQSAGGQLAQVANVFNALVTDPGPGKPKEVDAINRAAFVLSMAHFQGFVDELHAELGAIMLQGKATDPKAVIKLVKPSRSNPHVNVINQMFSGIGVYELMESVAWQRCDNETVKSRLTGYLTTRNKIAHGNRESITKAKVSQVKQFIELLAAKLDEKASSKAATTLGEKPW